MEKVPAMLVAEDDPADILLLQRAIAKAGLKVHVEFARNGHEVIEYLEGKSPRQGLSNPFPDLLVLDLRLPALDGFEVLEWFHLYPQYRPPQVVVLSSSCYPPDLARASALGVDHYLVKPSDPFELIGIVKRLEQCWRDVPAMVPVPQAVAYAPAAA